MPVEIRQSYLEELRIREKAQDHILQRCKEIGEISPVAECVCQLTVAREKIIESMAGMHPLDVGMVKLISSCEIIEAVIAQQLKLAEVHT